MMLFLYAIDVAADVDFSILRFHVPSELSAANTVKAETAIITSTLAPMNIRLRLLFRPGIRIRSGNAITNRALKWGRTPGSKIPVYPCLSVAKKIRFTPEKYF